MRGPHDALRVVHAAIMTERANWIVEAEFLRPS
jgi:hypothetical protein